MHPCPNCGRETHKKFCKESCGSAYRARIKRQAQAVPLPSKHCRRCGEPFNPTRSTQEFCRAECRRPPGEVEQGLPLGELDKTVYRLIARGFLPEPTCTSPSGEAAWTVEGLAALFNLGTMPFLGLMAQRPPVYLKEAGIPSSWQSLMEK